MFTNDFTALANQNASIILERLAAADPKLQLVVQGTLIDGEKLTQLDALEDAGIGYITVDQLGRRLDKLGMDRLGEVFTLLSPGCEAALMEAWEWMRTQPHRSSSGFAKSLQVSEKLNWEELDWLRCMANDLLITGCDPLGLARMAGAAVGNACSPAAADYLATAIVKGGPLANRIGEILLATLRGKTPGQGLSKLIIRAILRSDHPALRTELGLLLENAGLEESVVKLIAESANEGTDESFQHIIQCILANSQWRRPGISASFSAWTGAQWKAACIKHIPAVLEKLAQSLASQQTRLAWIQQGDAEMLYWALYVEARKDSGSATTKAAAILKQDEAAGRRFAALWILKRMAGDSDQEAIVNAMLDEDLGIALLAAQYVASYGGGEASSRVSPHCLALIKRLNKKTTTLTSPLWPWETHQVSSSFLQGIEKSYRQSEARKAKLKNIVGEPAVIEQLDFHALSFAGLKAQEPNQVKDWPEYWQTKLEQISIEAERGWKAVRIAIMDGTHDSDQDRGYLKLYDLMHEIMQQIAAWTDEEAIFAMVEHLLFHRTQELNKTGMLLLSKAAKAGRANARCRDCAQRYMKWKRIKQIRDAPIELRPVFDAPPEASTAWAVLGKLVRREELTQPAALNPQLEPAKAPTARLLLGALDDWLWSQRHTLIKNYRGEEVGLFQGGLLGAYGQSIQEALVEQPFLQLLSTWWLSRPDELRDADGMELTRANLFIADELTFPRHHSLRAANIEKAGSFLQHLYGTDQPLKLRDRSPVADCIRWLQRIHPVEDTSFLLSVLELRQLSMSAFDGFWASLTILNCFDVDLPADLGKRMWHAMVRQLSSDVPVVYARNVIRPHELGYATNSDLAYFILGQEDPQHRACLGAQATGETAKVLRRCVQVVAEYEIAHADEIPTLYSQAFLQGGGTTGAECVVRAAKLLESTGFERAKYLSEPNRVTVLSKIVKISSLDPAETLDGFSSLVRQCQLSEQQQINLAVYAPQWLDHVAHTLNQPELPDIVWWLIAHTSHADGFGSLPNSMLVHFSITERSRIEFLDLQDGAVDVAWFERAYAAIGARVWMLLVGAAKYSSPSQGHVRALIYADALLGTLKSSDMIELIRTKRHQDSVRALGLAKLPKAEKARQAEIRLRYDALVEYKRGTRDFGMQRRASEERAAIIGLENLARNAGYEDPIRMQWDLEASAVQKIFAKSTPVTLAGITVSLKIHSAGRVSLLLSKEGKTLKTAPASLKKDPVYTGRVEDRQQLQTRVTRARSALENLMVRGVIFRGQELSRLMQHPLLAPLLEALILVTGKHCGLPTGSGNALKLEDGTTVELKPECTWRIAHPHDLLPSKQWSHWQEQIVSSQVVQPFKQVFRELYVAVPAERTEDDQSNRYTGHRVRSAQCMALLAQRGWRYDADHGAYKTLHEANVTATLGFEEYFRSPNESEIITLANVSFRTRAVGRTKGIPLADVPAVIFSEVMRDLDLVVSVAWAGNTDPQFTPATLAMRHSLVKAIARSMQFSNVECSERVVLIEGTHGKYRIHLGSGVITGNSGNTILLSPSAPQARESLYLPFSDDDPRSAELISKVMLLAEDHVIKDAALINQLKAP